MTIETLLDIESWRAEGLIEEKATTIQLANKVLFPLYFRRHVLFTLGFEVHALLRNYILHDGALPEDIVQDCSLRPEIGATITLHPFIAAFDRILAILNLDSKAQYLVDRVLRAKEFYSVAKQMRAVIEQTKIKVNRELIHIYRARNRLVHGAYDRTLFLSALGDKASFYAKGLLHHALHVNPLDSGALRNSLCAIEAELL